MNQFLLTVTNFLLEQNAAERTITTIGVIVIAVMLIFAIIDMAVKEKFVPENPVLRAVIIILFLVALGVLILMKIYYK